MARRPSGKSLGRAAIGPLNVSVLGAGVVGAFALGLWPLAALGGVAYAALVATDVSGGERGVRSEPVAFPRTDKIADADVRKAAEAIVAARAEIDRVAREIPARVARHVRTALAALAELEGHAARLLVRADELSRYLATTAGDDSEAEAESLRAKAAAAKDRATREQYELASNAAADRARALADVRTARERSLANLSRIGATLRSIPPKLVRVRALDDQATDALTGDVGAEVDRMNIELTAFEQTLNDLVAPPLQETA